MRRFDSPGAMSAGAETHRETTGDVGASREGAGGADPPRAGANAALLARVEALHEVPGLEEEEAAAVATAAAGAEGRWWWRERRGRWWWRWQWKR